MKAKNQEAAVLMSGVHFTKKSSNMLVVKSLRIILATTFLIFSPLTANGSTYEKSIQDKNCPPLYIKYTPQANVTIDFYIFEVKRPPSAPPIEQSRTELHYITSFIERMKFEVAAVAISSKAAFVSQNSLKKPLGNCSGIDFDDGNLESFTCINPSSGRWYKPGSYVGKVKVYDEMGQVRIENYSEGRYPCREVFEDNNGEAFCSEDFPKDLTNGLKGGLTTGLGANSELAMEADGNWYGDRITYKHAFWGWIQNKPYIFVSKIRRSGYVCQRPPPGPAL